MIRCARCGVRRPEGQPICETHGISDAAGKAEGASRVYAPEAQVGAERVPRIPGYEVTGLLGTGGHASVHAAIRSSDGARIALKLAFDDQRASTERLEREAQALKRIGPPFVSALHERGQVEGRCFLALERIEAPTLAEFMLTAGGRLDFATFGPAALAILDALDGIHANGIVHADLKPENIFLDDQNQARLIDLGIAIDLRSPTPTLDTDVGTAEYMSPEQCDGRADLDLRSDIYSVGALFYEMVSGAPPFWGRAADVREAHRSRRPAPLTRTMHCPAELDGILRRCLSKTRELRPPDAHSLRCELERVLEGLHFSQHPASLRSSERPRRSSTPSRGVVNEKRVMGLVFFESRVGLPSVGALVVSCAGSVVQNKGAHYVAAFGHEAGDNPVLVSLAAARRLVATGLTARVLVDVATVTARARADGTQRLFSAAFGRADRMTGVDDPEGVILTEPAAELLPGLELVRCPMRSDRFTIRDSQGTDASSTFGDPLEDVVGREALIARLAESAREAHQNRCPTIFTIFGEPGFGKTALARLLAGSLRETFPSARVLRLMPQEGVVGSQSRLLPDLLRSLLSLGPVAPSDGGRSVILSRLGSSVGEPLWAAAALALGYIDADHPAVRRLAAAPGALRFAMARALGEAIRGCAEHEPLVIILDEAHLADDTTLDGFEYALLSEAASPIWMCALARSSFAVGRPNWASRAARQEQIHLGPLDPGDAVDLARSLLRPAEYVPLQALVRFVERTQRIPRLMVELARGLKRDGLVRKSERGTGYYFAADELERLPDLPIVQWNATREIAALPPQLAGHARLCSVLGRDFSLVEVEAILGVLESEGAPADMQLDAGVGVQRLVDAGILRRQRDGTLDFRHTLLGEAVLQALPELERGRLHRAALTAYRALRQEENRWIPQLALHAARCGNREEAATAYLDLAQRALGSQSYDEAERAYGSALANLPDQRDVRFSAAARGRGLMRFRLGRHELALGDLRVAGACARDLELRDLHCEILLDEATVLDWTCDFARSAELVETANAIETSWSELLSVRLMTNVARVHHRRGEADACVRLASEAATRASALGDEGHEPRAIALLMAATDCCTLGRLADAEHYLETVIGEARDRGDTYHLAAALNNRGFLHVARGDPEGLFEDMRHMCRIAREVGLPLLEFPALYNMGEAAYWVGDLDAAVDYTSRAIAVADRLWGDGNRELSGRELLLARIALLRGDLPTVRSALARIRQRVEEALARGATEAAFLPNEQMLFDGAELASREASDTEWEALAQRCEGLDLQAADEVELMEMRALAAYRANRRDASQRLYERALELSELKPSLLGPRIRHRYVKLFAAGPDGLPPAE